jgi:uridine phosphorylase
VSAAPIVGDKGHDEHSVLSPGALLARARALRALPEGRVPEVCVLDPDGLFMTGTRVANPSWACFHTTLAEVRGPPDLGVISCAVGGAFAVLVAEQLAEMGARLIVSIASAGALAARPCVGDLVVIDASLRDEGTSYHYLPAAEWIGPCSSLLRTVDAAVTNAGIVVQRAHSWTTDAPYRETPTSVAGALAAGACIVEMEAAALYAFGAACGVPVVCVAQVTNRLGTHDRDFAKADGTAELRLRLARAVARTWTTTRR